MAMAELPGPYDFQAYAVRARGITTNTCPMAPYRGVCRPAITLAMERLMDCAAVRFGLDPVEIRRRNLVQSFPYRTATGLTYDEGSYRRALELAAERIDVAAFRERQRAARAKGRYLGIGFAVFNERTGYGTPAFAARGMDITPGYERVELAMDPSGFVEARIGASPHGQGLATTLAQLLADELGLEPARIRIVHGDTDRTPYGWGTFASRSLVIAGGACKLAAERLRAKLAALAGHLLEAEAADIVLDRGKARVRGTDLAIELPKLARAAYHQSHRFGRDLDPALSVSATYDPAGTYSNACHVAVVEVDPETGHVALERFLVVEDAGRLINPMIVERPDLRRRRPGHRQRAVRGGGVRRRRQHPDRLARRLPAAHLRRDPADRDRAPGDHERRIGDQGEGARRGRGDRRAGGGAGRDLRCLAPVRDRGARDARDSAAHPGSAPGPRRRDAMTAKIDLVLEVNGRAYQVRIEPRRTLADALREDCGLTGTHLGCEHGVCGACTVLVDGDPVRSCLMFAVQAEGAAIRTVEGLANGEELHPLQQAFWDHHGLQCGFCTPGFLMLAAGVLEKQPAIGDEELRRVLASNLCRCTGYQNIIKAVRAAADQMKP